jgi:hypothetical protein
MTLTQQQIQLLSDRNAAEARGAAAEAGGGGIFSRALTRFRLAEIDQQLTGGAKKPAAAAAKPKPVAPVAPVAAAAVAPVAVPVAAAPVAAAPVLAPLPAAAAVAPIPEPTVVQAPAELAVAAAKTDEELRLAKIDQAREAEMKRQEEIRKRRGSGLSSFITGGLRGLPSTLSQLLGV